MCPVKPNLPFHVHYITNDCRLNILFIMFTQALVSPILFYCQAILRTKKIFPSPQTQYYILRPVFLFTARRGHLDFSFRWPSYHWNCKVVNNPIFYATIINISFLKSHVWLPHRASCISPTVLRMQFARF